MTALSSTGHFQHSWEEEGTDRKTTDMSLHLKQTCEAAVLTNMYPRSQIYIYVKVSAISDLN